MKIKLKAEKQKPKSKDPVLNTEFKVGQSVKLGNLVLNISQVVSIGQEPHYAIGVRCHGRMHWGWMPACVLDSIGDLAKKEK